MVKKIKNKKIEKKSKYREVKLGRRFLSYLLDWYIGALCASFPIAVISQKLYGTMLKQNILEFKEPYGLIGGILGIIFALFYFVIVPKYIYPGQTLGKHICKIKIIQEDGNDVTLKHLLLRQVLGIMVVEGTVVSASTLWHQLATILTNVDFVKPLMYAGFAIGGISALMVIFTKSHKAIHDYIGKTRVVMSE